MTDDIRDAVSSDLAHTGPGTGRDEYGTDALDALESLRALDTDRKTVNDRPVTATMATWSAAFTGTVMTINAVAYWLLGWTLLGGHAAFTRAEYWLYVGGAVLLVTLSTALLAYGQKRSGIGVWNGRLFWPDKRLLKDGRYRRVFTIYLTFVFAAPVAMLLIGVLYAPWWPVVALAPICGLVSAWISRRQTEAYAQVITTPLALDASDTPGKPDRPGGPQGTHGTPGTEATHDIG
ncbi:hypothetical protein [Bifidobacterium saguinibicoloris]|uniref:hypothetical protein n=1 Tax=Bifidobacterium saguinibicoloris TaxID=2834433 RepID=UPI001C58019A|nr:hypothetical protein [Bifidobacterium saguinibicoloris]MBW3080523.1 hypothetical protein [Bifidobacterium saguinibicoloris]